MLLYIAIDRRYPELPSCLLLASLCPGVGNSPHLSAQLGAAGDAREQGNEADRQEALGLRLC